LHIENTVILIVPWVSYLIAEGFGLSGIVSIIFCGISMARYALPNLAIEGKMLIN
jgi:sodium/hydrogen exchanger 8